METKHIEQHIPMSKLNSVEYIIRTSKLFSLWHYQKLETYTPSVSYYLSL